jgi:diguanylate cyclase (GGDEF)-like protein
MLTRHVDDICFATNGKDGLRIAEDRQPDVILLDAEMRDMDGYTVCRELKANPATSDIPVIFVTGHEDVSYEIRALEAGAADFITKPPNPARLRARVDTQVRMKQLTDQLRSAAAVDGLTGVASRRAFDEQMSTECRRASRNQQPVSLIMIDVDHFKRFNDRYGHVEGDRVLQAISATLRSSVRSPPDTVARYGGEEFAILLPETTNEQAVALAQRICQAVAALRIIHADSPSAPYVTLSAGVASLDPPAEGSQAPDVSVTTTCLISRADAALYRAKHEGRNRVATSSPLSDENSATTETTCAG